MDFFGVQGIFVLIIPVIVNVIKNLPYVGNKYAPLVAFSLGIIGGIVGFYYHLIPDTMSLTTSIMTGIAISGTSTGLYDITKKISEEPKIIETPKKVEIEDE